MHRFVCRTIVYYWNAGDVTVGCYFAWEGLKRYILGCSYHVEFLQQKKRNPSEMPDNWLGPRVEWHMQRPVAKARFPVFATEASAGKKVGKAGSSSIQRSVETGMAVEYPRGGSAMNRQASRESTDGSMNSYSSEGKYVHADNIAKTQDNTQRALSVFLWCIYVPYQTSKSSIFGVFFFILTPTPTNILALWIMIKLIVNPLRSELSSVTTLRLLLTFSTLSNQNRSFLFCFVGCREQKVIFLNNKHQMLLRIFGKSFYWFSKN